jgi:hypothetical protein
MKRPRNDKRRRTAIMQIEKWRNKPPNDPLSPLLSRPPKLIPTGLRILHLNLNPRLHHLPPPNLHPTLDPIPSNQTRDPARRSRQDQIPLLQRHDPAHLGQQAWDPKQHRPRPPPLPLDPIHPQPDHHVPVSAAAAIPHPPARHRLTDRTKGIEPLGDRPRQALPLRVVLHVARGEVDGEAVGAYGAGDGRRVRGQREILQASGDDEAELDLVVQVRAARPDDGARIGRQQRAGGFEEEEWLCRARGGELGDVVAGGRS